MKRLLPFLLLALLLPVTINAHDFEVNGIYYNKNGTNATVTYRGTSYSQYSDEYSGSVTIPSTVTYNGTTYSVTTIGYRAFSRCSNLTNITIPTSVTSIDNYAFSYCSGLTSVIIPNYVTTIGTSSFSDCTSLTSVTIGNSVTSIGGYAFDGCSILTSVTIPNSVTSIDGTAFTKCNNLTSIKVNSGNTTYDSRNNCNAIIETASNTLIVGCKNTIIPNSVTAIGERAFYCCYGLTSIAIPNSVKAIGNNAFSLCYNLTSLIIPNSVTTIGHLAFTACSSLTSVTIGSSVTSIGSYAFGECENLTSVNIPNSVTSIGEAAFKECSSLSSVTIPNSVTTIGNEAFSSCRSLASIKVESGNTVYDSRNNCNAIIKTASNTLIAGCKNSTIPNTVTVIGDYAFYECNGLTNINIPNSVTTIGDAAFCSCSGLTDVTIPNSVITIGYSAFSGCSGLTIVICQASTPPTMAGSSVFSNYSTPTLYVPAASLQAYQTTDYWNQFTKISSIEELEDGKFEVDGIYYYINDEEAIVTYRGKYSYSFNNEYSGSVTIPPTVTYNGKTYPVTSIGDQTFQNCTGVTSVSIPNSVTAIGNSAFYECSGLTSIIIPNSVTSIGYSAFERCSGLTSVTIGNSVTTIGDYAFQYCSSLINVIIPNSVTTIGKSAFSSCRGLTSINVDSDNTIYDSRDNCNAIIETSTNKLILGCKNTVIPNSVTSIGDNAFYGCTDMTNVTIPNFVTTIGNYAFGFCQGMTNLIIPNSVTTIGNSAFYQCSGLTSVTISNSVTSIGTSAFASCRGLTNLTIPNSVTTIGFSSFSECSGLTSLNIGNSVTTIGGGAFHACSGLTSINIPSSVISIGDGAFSFCNSLTSIEVDSGNNTYDSRDNCNAIIETASNTLIAGCKNTTIPNSVTTIGRQAFYGCTNMISVTIPNSVTSIGNAAFASCSGLTSVAIPNSVRSVGEWAFSRCTCLTSVTIPNSVTAIGVSAFEESTGLTSVIIGNSVTSLGRNAFYHCSALSKVICRADVPPTMGGSSVFSDYTTPTLYVPEESLQAYQTTDYWNRFTNILSIGQLQNDQFEVNGIYYYIIGDEAVVTYRGTSYSEYSNEYSGTVNIPSTVIHDGVTYPVTTIGEYAFSDCRNLLKVIIPNSVTTIEKEAFYECTGLTSLTLPNSVTTIREAAFYGCTGLMGDLVIPESVTHLGEAVFIDCRGLTSVTILGPITRINDELFYGCTGLTSVTLPNTITFIGDASFEDCTSLTNLVIPNSVDSIIYCAFNGCVALTEIIIPNSVTHIGKHVFSECTGLTSVSIGNSVTEILEDAFGYCTNLTSIVVADDNPVFDSRDHCNGIIETATNTLIVGCKGTVIPGTVTTIGEAAFEGISSMTSVTIPASITLMESSVFDACFGLTSVICKAVTPPAMEDSYVFPNSTYSNATLYVPSSSLQAYRTTDYWNRFTNILPFEDYATAMPTITTELSIGAMTVAATGAGTVVLMVDGVVVDNPCDIPRTDQSRTVRVTATAQEEGKLVSDIATLDVTIPAILPLNTDNYLSMSDTTVVRGATVTIPVRMTNTSEIISFQTDISLAEGLEVVQEDGEYVIDRSDRMTRTHSLSSNRMSNGDIRVLCYSSNYKAFTGNSGDILFYITVRATGTADGAQSMTLKNTLFTDRDFNELRAPDAYATVTVLPYLKGDANGSGTVTVTDVVVTALRVLDYDPQPFVFESADVNEDGIISVTDVSRIAWMVLNPTQNSPLRSPVLCDNVDRMSGGDITLVPGQTRTVSISLDNVMSYSAFQLDLTLPEGLTASNFRLTDRAGGHTLDVNTLSNGAIRALCYSPSLATITGHGGALLTFDVTSMGSPTGLITVDGIECVTDACQTMKLAPFSIGVNTTTTVGETVAGKTVERIDYYNVSGQRVAQPVSGVTIVVTTYSDGSSEVTKLYR